jgi:hypothetical protein
VNLRRRSPAQGLCKRAKRCVIASTPIQCTRGLRLRDLSKHTWLGHDGPRLRFQQPACAGDRPPHSRHGLRPGALGLQGPLPVPAAAGQVGGGARARAWWRRRCIGGVRALCMCVASPAAVAGTLTDRQPRPLLLAPACLARRRASTSRQSCGWWSASGACRARANVCGVGLELQSASTAWLLRCTAIPTTPPHTHTHPHTHTQPCHRLPTHTAAAAALLPCAVPRPRSHTLGGVYLARYDDSPVGAFDEVRAHACARVRACVCVHVCACGWGGGCAGREWAGVLCAAVAAGATPAASCRRAPLTPPVRGRASLVHHLCYTHARTHAHATPRAQCVVMAGLVWNPPTSCAWAARVFVSDAAARDHGVASVGLPSRLAAFEPAARGGSGSSSRGGCDAGQRAQQQPALAAGGAGSSWWGLWQQQQQRTRAGSASAACGEVLALRNVQRGQRGLPGRPVALLGLPRAASSGGGSGWRGPRLRLSLPSFRWVRAGAGGASHGHRGHALSCRGCWLLLLLLLPCATRRPAAWTGGPPPPPLHAAAARASTLACCSTAATCAPASCPSHP